MGREKTLYTRRLSLDESRENYILISKEALSMFPSPGKAFKAGINGKDEEVSIEAVLCSCRGPDNRHEHYHLSLAQAETKSRIRKGSLVSIRKEESSYNIEVR
jgi:hypothetical protein